MYLRAYVRLANACSTIRGEYKILRKEGCKTFLQIHATTWSFSERISMLPLSSS